MPTFIHIVNLVIDKAAVQKKYKGGINQFRKDYHIDDENNHEEDQELFSIAAMNSSEFDFVDLLSEGFSFDYERNFSEDFTIIHRYGGAAWEPSWLQYNTTFAWHKNSDPAKIARAQEINNMPMDKIAAAFDRGEKPWDTIY